MTQFYQGEIYKIIGIKYPVLVVSKDFYNQSGNAICCPIVTMGVDSPICKFITADDITGYVYCDETRKIDMHARVSKRVGKVSLTDIITISDIIQGLYDYV